MVYRSHSLVYLFHNYKVLKENNTGPYFYLPKIENHKEARLWSEVFKFSEENFNLPKGTIKATVLIETILAAFEMDEILYELKDNIVGLNCGRWDYIFSFIKKFRNRLDFLLPNRSLVSMRVHFMKSYSELLIQTCHKRRAHAIGGMAAQIPIKEDASLDQYKIESVKIDPGDVLFFNMFLIHRSGINTSNKIDFSRYICQKIYLWLWIRLYNRLQEHLYVIKKRLTLCSKFSILLL